MMSNRIIVIKGFLVNSDACFEFKEDLIWSCASDVVTYYDLKIAFKDILDKDYSYTQIMECAKQMPWCLFSEHHITSNECAIGITIENFIELLDCLSNT